jgi:hypothetical protein
MLTTLLLNIERVDLLRTGKRLGKYIGLMWLCMQLNEFSALPCPHPRWLPTFDYICSSTTEELQVMRGAGCND